MFLYFCIHIQKRNYMRLGLLTAFILLLSFTTSCQYKEAQPHPAFKDSIVLVTPVEPQPITSKSQTAFYLDSIGCGSTGVTRTMESLNAGWGCASLY